MKIEELFHESFNSELPVSWDVSGSKLLGFFSLENRDYVIEVFSTDISELQTEITSLIEISFKGKDRDDNEYSYHGSKNTNATHSATVFSTVINAVDKKVKLTSESAIYFSAKKNDNFFESRRKMYRTLSRVLSKKFDAQWTNIEFPNYEVYLLSKKIIQKEHLKQLILHIID